MASRIGFVGLGAMGASMAGRLLSADHELLVHNRTAAKMSPLVARGALPAANLVEVARQSTVVLSCLTDDAAVREVYLGPSGLISAARPGQIFVEHGTYSPSLAREIAAVAQRLGAAFLDGPVTGGPEGAAAGTLAVMVGGPRPEFDVVEPLLRAYAARVEWIGGPGRGLELKLVNQLLVGCHVAAYAEAAALMRALQLPWEAATKVLCSGWAASAMLERCLERAGSDDFEGRGATIAGLVEVERHVLELAETNGVAVSLLPVAQALMVRAVDAGMGKHDVAALVTLLQEQS